MRRRYAASSLRGIPTPVRLAHWGIAYAAGPNYNKQWKAFDTVDLKRSLALAYGATSRAMACLYHASPVERALIGALRQSLPADEPDEVSPLERRLCPCHARRLSRAFRTISTSRRSSPSDHEPHALAALDLKSRRAGGGRRHARAVRVLETAMAAPRGTDHPACSHMYIHLMEMSPHPERGAARGGWSAQSRPGCRPSPAHAEHHIDVLCGQYWNVVEFGARARGCRSIGRGRTRPKSRRATEGLYLFNTKCCKRSGRGIYIDTNAPQLRPRSAPSRLHCDISIFTILAQKYVVVGRHVAGDGRTGTRLRRPSRRAQRPLGKWGRQSPMRGCTCGAGPDGRSAGRGIAVLDGPDSLEPCRAPSAGRPLFRSQSCQGRGAVQIASAKSAATSGSSNARDRRRAWHGQYVRRSRIGLDLIRPARRGSGCLARQSERPFDGAR